MAEDTLRDGRIASWIRGVYSSISLLLEIFTSSAVASHPHVPDFSHSLRRSPAWALTVCTGNVSARTVGGVCRLFPGIGSCTIIEEGKHMKYGPWSECAQRRK